MQIRAISLCSLFTSFPAVLLGGPISELYVSSASLCGGVCVVQGNAVVRSWAMQNPSEYVIAVDGDVRTTGQTFHAPGAQYTLAGTYTGTNYQEPVFTSSGETYQDSTTDGTHNYIISSNGAVYQTNRDYTNPLLLFILGGISWQGITYDPTNNSLWTLYYGGPISNYTMTGTLLSTFDPGSVLHPMLALDPADQTLWTVDNNGHSLQQYSKSGVHLSTGITLGGTGGGEFDFQGFQAPEPSSLALAAAGALFLALRLRRAKRR